MGSSNVVPGTGLALMLLKLNRIDQIWFIYNVVPGRLVHSDATISNPFSLNEWPHGWFRYTVVPDTG